MILQYCQCLRPSEALALTWDSFITGGESLTAPGVGCLFLGQGTGTKAGRPQVSLVRDPLALRLLSWFRAHWARGQRLSKIGSLSAYSRRRNLAAAAFHLGHLGWTPHSPRAGYASDAAIAGRVFNEVREEGRWTCDRSLRGYMDVQAVMGGELQHQLQAFAPLLTELANNFDSFFRR